MSKEPIEWHRQCHDNTVQYLARERERLERQLVELANQEARCAFYGQQIDEAVKRKLDGFDAERFLVKREKTK